MPDLAADLDNCMINFDQKVVVTNLLDEYGGQLEEIARTVNEFLTAEEAKGKKYLKTFLLRGLQPDSENEVITLVPADKLEQREQQLRDAHSVLYSAETDGGSKAPATEFVPLKHISIKLDNLEVRPGKQASAVTNGQTSAAKEVKDEKPTEKKTGALGAMFKKQETAAAAVSKKSLDLPKSKKEEPEKPSGSLGAMFKKQETAAATGSKKSPDLTKLKKEEPEKQSGSLGAMLKKQESAAASKKSPYTEKKPKPTPEKTKKQEAASKKGITGFLAKNDDSEKPKASVLKPPTPKKMNDFFRKEDAKKIKEEPNATPAKKPKEEPNVSVNLFEESSSSEDEEALDALKREVLTDEDDDKAPTTSKRRRIVDSDDEDDGPEVKVERKEEESEPMEEDDGQANESATFLDEDGFIVTVKAKNKKPAPKSKPAPTPVKIKMESPPAPAKKEAASKPPPAKKKQGNIMSFFTKK